MNTVIDNLITNVGTLLILIIAYKSGLLKAIMNGRFWNGGKTTDAKIDELTNNHFHELKDGQKEICSKLDEIIKYGVRIRNK